MDPYLGEIRLFAGNYAPQDWALCNGTSLAIAEYQALYAVIGTTYGGNGITTFNLPNLKGRVIVGSGPAVPNARNPASNVYNLNQQVGSTTVSLTAAELPQHTHTLNASKNAATAMSPQGNVLADPVDTQNLYVPVTSTTKRLALNAATLAKEGNGMPINNIMPCLALTYIIALVGLYPTAN